MLRKIMVGVAAAIACATVVPIASAKTTTGHPKKQKGSITRVTHNPKPCGKRGGWLINISLKPYYIITCTGRNGEQGVAGPQGVTGKNGTNGTNGKDGNEGLSAYEIWLSLGNTGTARDFIQSLQGVPGAQGLPGLNGLNGESAYQLWLDAGNTGTMSDFMQSLQGAVGADGAPGLSAYQIWLNQGNSGTVAAFLQSLKGAQGPQGPQGPQGSVGAPGSPGMPGPQGLTGAAGQPGGTGQTGAQGPAGPSTSATFIPSGTIPTSWGPTVGSTTITTTAGENNLVINGDMYFLDGNSNPSSPGDMVACQLYIDGQLGFSSVGAGSDQDGSVTVGQYNQMSIAGYISLSGYAPGQHTVSLECVDMYEGGSTVYGGHVNVIATG